LPFELKIASLSKDSQLLQYVRQVAMEILDEDPQLVLSQNAILNLQLEKAEKQKVNFSQIS
jgi:ATP-dependent DNA helicase RecG